jgi:HSP20 family protein
MAQRTGERATERAVERGSESGSANVPAQGSSGSGMMQRQGGSIAAGPFSLIDWMLDRLQRDFFGSATGGGIQALGQGGGGSTRIPRLNINETDNEVIVTAEVPGVDPKDVQVEIEDDVLTLRAEAREERDEDGGRVVSHTRFFTQLPLPDEIDASNITASSRHGMVTIRFPKREQTRSTRRIPVEGASNDGGSSQDQQRAA